MSKAGKRLLRGAYQALKYAEGRAEPDTYRIHQPDAGSNKVTKNSSEIDGANSAKQATPLEASDSHAQHQGNIADASVLEPRILDIRE